ncbi:MAG: glycosyltransferase family 4 protein [Bacteroidota bacterium]
MKKITFISNSLGPGGGERVLCIIANQLLKRNYDISIITLRTETNDAFHLDYNIKRIKLLKKWLGNYTISNFINLFLYLIKKRNRPNVLISFMTETNAMTIIVARLFRIKIIVSEHTNHKNVHGYDNFIRKIIYRLANKVVALTDFDTEFYVKHGSSAVTIHNPSSFSPISQECNRKKVVLALGNLSKYHVKGFDTLIKACGPVFKRYSSWELHIYGQIDETCHEKLSSLAKDNKIYSRVKFKGFCSDVATIMSQAEIFVLSSRREGLPMVLIEALSQGMACVAFDCITGPSEIIENNKNGLLIANQDKGKLSEGILYLIENEEVRAKFQKEAPNSIKKFGVDKITRQWEELLKLF